MVAGYRFWRWVKNSPDIKKYFSYFTQKIGLRRQYAWTVKFPEIGFDISCKLPPHETICKTSVYFLRKKSTKKNRLFSSAELSHRVGSHYKVFGDTSGRRCLHSPQQSRFRHVQSAQRTLITKTRLFKCIENYTSKNWKYSDKKKNSDIFHISAQNINCGYSLEPPRRGGSNEYPQSMFFNRNKKKIMYTL